MSPSRSPRCARSSARLGSSIRPLDPPRGGSAGRCSADTAVPAGPSKALCPRRASSCSWARRTPRTGTSSSFSAPLRRSGCARASSARTACSEGRWAISCADSAGCRPTARRRATWSCRWRPSSRRTTNSRQSSQPKARESRPPAGVPAIIAHRPGGVPIVCVGPDYERRVGIFGPVVLPTGD